MFSSVLILTVFFVVWALVHSLLASLPFKDWTRRVFSDGVDRWYRLAFNALAAITILPIYSFSLLLLWLTPAMTVNLLTIYILITLYLYVGSLHEERRLLTEFGDAYRDYQQQVPRLIPRPGRCYSPPSG